MQRKSACFGKWHVFVFAFVIAMLSTFICTDSLAKEQGSAKDLQSQKQLTTEELQWLHQHGKIRMAYISNLLGNCAKAPATGKLIGSLATYVDGAKNCFTNGQLEFIPFAYPSIEAEIAALERGEVDCIFPLYTDASQAEKRGFLVTQSLFNCDVVALSRQASFDETKAKIVALAGAKINKRIYLEKHYPHWQIKQYKSDRACVEAVKRGEADCAIFNSYGIEHIIPATEISHLHMQALVGSMDLSLAVRSDAPQLQAILDRSVTLVSPEVLNNSMKSFARPESLTQTAALSGQGKLWHNKAFLVMAVITLLSVCVILVVVLFTLRNRKTEHKLQEAEAKVEALTKQLQTQQANHKQ